MLKSTIQTKAAVVSVAGLELTNEELALFKAHQPVGYILFSRNYKDVVQLKKLIASLRSIADHDYTLIMIDQEGEKVSRLKPPHFTVLRDAQVYGENAKLDLQGTTDLLYADWKKVGAELCDVGINVDCAPVADLFHEEAHHIIGSRSFGSNVEIVTELCQVVESALKSSKVQAIIKHIPGHGRASSDSHIELPRISTPLAILEQTDFKVFQNLSTTKLAMTAHVIFEALDRDNPVTLSTKAISYIRGKLGYEGLLITDALDMKAIKHDVAEACNRSLQAGCDIMLFCENNLTKVKMMLETVPYFNNKQLALLSNLDCFM